MHFSYILMPLYVMDEQAHAPRTFQVWVGLKGGRVIRRPMHLNLAQDEDIYCTKFGLLQRLLWGYFSYSCTVVPW